MSLQEEIEATKKNIAQNFSNLEKLLHSKKVETPSPLIKIASRAQAFKIAQKQDFKIKTEREVSQLTAPAPILLRRIEELEVLLEEARGEISEVYRQIRKKDETIVLQEKALSVLRESFAVLKQESIEQAQKNKTLSQTLAAIGNPTARREKSDFLSPQEQAERKVLGEQLKTLTLRRRKSGQFFWQVHRKFLDLQHKLQFLTDKQNAPEKNALEDKLKIDQLSKELDQALEKNAELQDEITRLNSPA